MTVNPPSTRALGYRPALDGLRGVAVFLVLWQHAALPGLPHGATVGVTLFFVLSGFLITRLLVEERNRTGEINLPAFYWRRGLRLLPALGLLLLPMAILGFDVVPTAFYYANIAMASGEELGPLAHTWSLSVEEQFYLIWPVTLIGLLILPRRWALASLIVLAAGAMILRWVYWPDGDRVFWAPDTRADALLLGAALGLIPRLPRVHKAGILGAVTLVAIPALVESHAFLALTGLTLAALGSVVLVAAAAQTERSPWRPVVLLGVISYGVYLWSGPFLLWGREQIGPLAAIATIPATIAVAALSYQFVERRFLALKSLSPSSLVRVPQTADPLDSGVLDSRRLRRIPPQPEVRVGPDRDTAEE